MIIASIREGLGNQLFQYAAARALSHRLGTALRLDLSWFKYWPRRVYQLDLFSIHATVIGRLEDKFVKVLRLPRIRSSVERLQRLKIPLGFTLLRDPEQGFDTRFLSLRGRIYLDGFWQSERYFQEVAPLLRQELRFKAEPDETNRALVQQIRSCEAVVLHIRRGDFVSDPLYHSRHGVCDLDYYHRGLALLKDRIKDPHYFIFSDDPEWTSDHLKLSGPCTYVSHNTGKQDHEDLRLMSQGKHFVIANSTFSWWGAWLSDRPNKLVIAPRRWYKSNDLPCHDLVPETWMRI